MSHERDRVSTMPDMILRGLDHREVERVHMAMADFLCWAAGYSAALHQDELGRRGIDGVYHVRRAREILQRLRVVDTPSSASSPASPGNMDAGRRQAEKAAFREMFAESAEAAKADLQPAGWTAPGWVTGPRALFETAVECAEHMRLVGNTDPRGPLPIYAEPRSPAMPAEGIVGWMLQRREGDERRLFFHHDSALEWHEDQPGAWHAPVPLYAQPQPAAAPDWPREISDSMALDYGETLRLALQAGEDDAGAARAVLANFMRSHRPAADLPPTFTIEQAEALSETLTHALREGDDHPQATKRVIDEFLRARVTERFASSAPLTVDGASVGIPDAWAQVDETGLHTFWRSSQHEHAWRAAKAMNQDLVPLYRAPVPAYLPKPSAYIVTDANGREIIYAGSFKEEAQRHATAARTDLRPLYAAPHPAVLPAGFIGMPEKPTLAMMIGSDAARRMIVADENEAGWAKRLYDAFVINRPQMPG